MKDYCLMDVTVNPVDAMVDILLIERHMDGIITHYVLVNNYRIRPDFDGQDPRLWFHWFVRQFFC